MVTKKEFKEIEKSGCNFHQGMSLKAKNNLLKVNKIREESNKELKRILCV